MRVPARPLVALPLVACVLGCAAKPVGPPIVLHRPHTEPVAAHRPLARPRPSTAVAAAPQPASPGSTAAPVDSAPAELTAAEKEALFQQFDAHLKRSGP